MSHFVSPDLQEWESTSSRRQSTVSTSTVSSASTSVLFQSPATSPGSRKQSWQLYDDVVRLELTPSVTISFLKNGQLFKLRYSYIDVCKDSIGTLKCLELGGGLGQQTPFVHAFHNTRLPVPHLEHPKESEDYPLRVSFLDHQTVQTAQVVFMTQLSYKFENWEDCVRFQELLLGSKLVFMGGMAEAKSKGRGEECISQNLRILRGQNNKRIMLFFANSQRRELKRYVSIPLNCIDKVKPPKKVGRPVLVELNPNFELLAQMRNLQITFLEDEAGRLSIRDDRNTSCTEWTTYNGRARPSTFLPQPSRRPCVAAMGKFHARLYKTDRARDFDHEQDRYVRMRQIYETIDRQGYQWIVVLVAGLGFFLDGYTLFASNMALPMISYVYWKDETSSIRLTCINIATLAGTLFGMVLFGFLADKNGRKKMYGVELVLLITATLGVVMSSDGESGSMSVYAWLIWWRICVGIGVGADYPLSAVITSEFAPTKQRARMMASVFFMQPLGQIAGNLVSLIVIAVARGSDSDDLIRTVDSAWRWVLGIGVVPGAIATLFRFAIPESPRYLVEIEDDPVTAEFDATTLFTEPMGSPTFDGSFGNFGTMTTVTGSSIQMPPISSLASNSMHDDDDDYARLAPATLNSHWRLASTDIVRYFWTEGNWRTLAGTSIAWLLLDFGFYGINISSPQFLAKTWGSLHITSPKPYWMTDDRPGASVYQMFFDTSLHGLIILNIGSLAGGLLLISLAHRIDRVALQKYMFLVLSALFIALGSMFVSLYTYPPVVVMLYIIGQILFNFGPNATTYMIPAETFPTRYRATCYGLSAGAGKLGSILVQIFSTYYHFGTGPGSQSTNHHGIILFVFSACMIIGAAVTHFWIPPLQENRGKNGLLGGKPYTLETMALGRMGRKSRDAEIRKRASRQRATSFSG
ncbi:uncharacterized protein N7459_005735 [Penicillium hispanicum]|uniref:uncharacterized protein n=1 Tax=Penicillium hispanicum TaxID=1080232 RepID=UPI00254022CE|nr:uncharacterized protein N7459_005735 [Penicillium hispanicum]KAJ5579750.1 hypothetical protein N7459_005735 [Penicillium hispanicum]